MVLEEYIKEKDIKDKVKDLGILISNFYPKDSRLTVVCVLKGSLLFAADLIREIDLDINLHFLDLSSYSGMDRGDIVLHKEIDFSVTGKDILIHQKIFRKSIIQKNSNKSMNQKKAIHHYLKQLILSLDIKSMKCI